MASRRPGSTGAAARSGRPDKATHPTERGPRPPGPGPPPNSARRRHGPDAEQVPHQPERVAGRRARSTAPSWPPGPGPRPARGGSARRGGRARRRRRSRRRGPWPSTTGATSERNAFSPHCVSRYWPSSTACVSRLMTRPPTSRRRRARTRVAASVWRRLPTTTSQPSSTRSSRTSELVGRVGEVGVGERDRPAPGDGSTAAHGRALAPVRGMHDAPRPPRRLRLGPRCRRRTRRRRRRSRGPRPRPRSRAPPGCGRPPRRPVRAGGTRAAPPTGGGRPAAGGRWAGPACSARTARWKSRRWPTTRTRAATATATTLAASTATAPGSSSIPTRRIDSTARSTSAATRATAVNRRAVADPADERVGAPVGDPVEQVRDGSGDGEGDRVGGDDGPAGADLEGQQEADVDAGGHEDGRRRAEPSASVPGAHRHLVGLVLGAGLGVGRAPDLAAGDDQVPITRLGRRRAGVVVARAAGARRRAGGGRAAPGRRCRGG